MGEKQVTGKISLVDAMSAPLRQMTQHMEQTSRAARELDTALRFQGTNVVPLHQATQSTSQLDHNVVQLTSHLHQSAQGTTQFGNNLQHLNTDLNQSTQRVNQLEHEMQQLRQEFQQSAQQVNQLEQHLQTMERNLQESAQRVNTLETQVEQLTREMQEATTQINQLNAALARAPIDDAAARMQRLRERFGGVSEQNALMLQGLERASGALFSTGAAATMAGGAIAMGLGSSVKVAADFESQMAKVGAISGATGGQLSSLTETAKELGASTTKSASEVAVGMQNLAASGFEVNDIIGAMPGIIAASEAAQEDMAMTSETVAAALNAFGMEAKESSHIADVLSQSANQSAAGILDMQYSFKYAAPVAKMLGISLEQLSAATGIMADAGIKGEMAGTALRASLLRLSDPPKSAQKALDALGVTITDSGGKMKPFHEIIGKIGDATKDMGNAQKAAALSNIFGTEAVSGMLAVVNAGPDKLQKLTQGLKDSGGAAADTAKKMQDNLNGSLNQLSGSFETLQISVGNALIPMIRVIADGLGMLTDAFNALPGPVQTVLTVILALVGVFLLLAGPVLLILGFLPGIIEGFALLAGAMSMSSAALLGVAGTAMTVIGVIAAIAIGIALLWSYSETFRSIVYAAIDGVKAAFDSLMVKVNQVKAFLATAWSGVQAIFGGNEGKGVSILSRLGFTPEATKTIVSVTNGIKNAINQIKQQMTNLGQFTKGIGALFGGNTGKGVSILSSLGLSPQTIRSAITIINGVRTAVTNGMNGVMSTVRAIGTGITRFWSQHGQQIVQYAVAAYSGLRSMVSTVLSGVGSVVRSLLTGIANFWSQHGTQIMNFASIAWRGIWTTISIILSAVGSIVSAGLSAIALFWNAHGSQIMSTVSATFSFVAAIVGNCLNFMSGLFQAVMPIVSGVTQVAFAIIQTVISVAGSVISGVVQVVSNLFHGEWRAAFEAAKQTAVDIWDAIVNTFEGIDLFQIGKDIINGLINGISSMASAAWDAVGNIASGIASTVTGFFDMHSPSRLMFEKGEFVTEGIALGIVHKTDMAVKAAEHVSEKSSIPFADVGKGKSYTSNNVNNSNKSSVKNEFNVTISADAARAMNTDDATFKELADKFINYVADKLDDVNNASTKVNLGVMEQ
ncbi:phage tail tape measure protein [Bacillus mobilis]|uniref:Phage tail tape measure protein n=2 Tax=Bacillus cereus group TaxID=86661 RepID=A0A1C4CAH5_BACCE|nr:MULTISPECIES: phage tail tape measure protein [Bacillus cereus group]OKA34374.1 phage tail tape measure protein [Bacillus cereus]OKA38143.1 phage tail tape measure protein [Bacillus cereus]SCC16129.1 Putative tail tape measure protein [Bacillus mobilis]